MEENQNLPNNIDQSWVSNGEKNQTQEITEISQKPYEQKPTLPIIEKPTNTFQEIFQALGIFIGCFIFIYLFLTFPAYLAKANFYWNKYSHKTTKTLSIPNNIVETQGDILLSTLKAALDSAPDKTIKKQYVIDISDLENNYLIIPKISIKTPIIWGVVPDENIMQRNLQNGVIHYQGTALPNEEKGNIFISGHSSYYWWDKGNYKTIFTNLDQLDNGDEIALAYNEKIYIYRVFDKVVIKPDQIDVLLPAEKPILSLMTCVPVGTNLKRLVIKAERLQITSSKEQQEQEELKKLEEIQKQTQENQNIQDQTSVEQKSSEKTIPPIEKNPLELLPWID